mgnify:CR=1 FL=1
MYFGKKGRSITMMGNNEDITVYSAPDNVLYVGGEQQKV